MEPQKASQLKLHIDPSLRYSISLRSTFLLSSALGSVFQQYSSVFFFVRCDQSLSNSILRLPGKISLQLNDHLCQPLNSLQERLLTALFSCVDSSRESSHIPACSMGNVVSSYSQVRPRCDSPLTLLRLRASTPFQHFIAQNADCKSQHLLFCLSLDYSRARSSPLFCREIPSIPNSRSQE